MNGDGVGLVLGHRPDGAPIYYDGARPLFIEHRIHEDTRGFLYEIYRTDVGLPFDAKQVYCSAIRPGVIKGWHRHKEQWDFVTCVHGEIQLACYKDDVEAGEEWVLSQRMAASVIIPPMWWHGWRNIGGETALIVNCVSVCYDREHPDEERKPPFQANPDVWVTRHG